MSTFGWFSLVILPVLGGLIAWAGDVIGYRLGKSRRSLFGLRPRTTARLVGVTVGVALPLVGVGTALLGSRDARDAVFHIDELRREQATLTQQNQQLNAQIQTARTQAVTARQQARQSESRAFELRVFLRDTTENLRVARQQVAGASQRLTQAQREVAGARVETGNLQRIRARLNTTIQTLQRTLGALQGQLSRAQHEVEQKAGELALTSAELDARKRDLGEYERTYRVLIKSPVVLETGHELVRIILETGDTVEETEAELVTVVLAAASEAAAAQGAEASPGGLAVRLMRPLPAQWENEDELPEEADILRAFAAERQTAGKRRWVVGVRVARRMYRDEVGPVGVELWALPYVRAFVEGDVIYSVELDGSGSRTEIFTQLWNLVKQIVRREAKARGMLADPDTGEYGSIPVAQLLAAMDEVAAAGGPVQVRVIAAKDAYIADPLFIRIEVGKGETASRGSGHSGG
jgi:uncharacterized protein (DUF3084 family)